MSTSANDLLESSSLFPSQAQSELGTTWFVAHARPRQAKLLAEELAAAGVRCYFPTVMQLRYYAGRAANVAVPLFGDTVFVLATPLNLAEVQRTGRVIDLLPVEDCVTLTRQLRQIYLAIENGASICVREYEATHAIAAAVRSGPLQGIRGLLTDSQTEQALVLPLSAIGLAAVIDLNGAEVGSVQDSGADIGTAGLPDGPTNGWPVPAPNQGS